METERCEATKNGLKCNLVKHHESSMNPTPHSFDYCVPLGRELTPREHAEHLENHAALARNMADSRPAEERPYHLATAATMDAGALAVRRTIP